ncbi:MAG: endonuclease VIII [Pseudonocardiales bacterium]|nr:MAG: endonuclease VIII [Pseudonocardiales bacterium]
MPELPEVEALAAFLRERVIGHFVTRVDVAAISVLKTYDPLPSSLAGQQVTGVGRHGKFLDLDCDGLHLVVHLARAGWLHWRDKLSPVPPKPGRGPIALRVHFDDEAGFDLTEAGTKKRLSVYVVRDPLTLPGIVRLGVDPLADDFTVDVLVATLAGARQQIKGVLVDQTVIAGIGNAYSDEILHLARLSPFKLGAKLTSQEVGRLHDAVVSTLRDAVTRSVGQGSATLKGEKRSGLRVHARTGLPCPVCGDTVREVSFADKSLQYCPTCQTGGQPLADRRLSRLIR